MKPELVYSCLLPSIRVLFPGPPDYASPRACALLLTIGGVESEYLHRQQLMGGIRDWWRSLNGHAVGYLQCERIGIRGVMEHPRTGPMLRKVCDILGYPFDLETLWSATRYDLFIAFAIARLIIWKDPAPLPGPGEREPARQYYLRNWRPGKPCDATKWNLWHDRAWRIVLDDVGQNGGVL